MKQCPSCKQTYPDDAPDYCSNDGVRLVREEAAMFDPEKTVMSSGQRANEPAASKDLPPPAAAAASPQQYQEASQSASPPPPSQPQGSSQPPQQWQQQGGSQYAPQGWTPPPTPQAAPPAPVWGSPLQQPQSNVPYGVPYAPPQSGRSRALAIAALVFGTNAITIMLVRMLTGMPYGPFSRIKIIMGILSIAGIGLGVAALVMALKKSSRFGGVEMAIAGLATGTAALVYLLLN